MSSVSVENATCEDKYIAMAQWWQRHCKVFSEWFLLLNDAQRKQLILKACPDIPTKVASDEREMKITDILLPELSLERFEGSNGRGLILFMTERCVSPTHCQAEDCLFLNGLFQKNRLPSFSRGAFKDLDTPFVDPTDPSEAIKALGPNTTPEIRASVMDSIAVDHLIHADVWLALKVRRNALISVFMSLVTAFETEVTVKPSPMFEALLLGELRQQEAMDALEVETENAVEETAAPVSVPPAPPSSSSSSSSSVFAQAIATGGSIAAAAANAGSNSNKASK